MKTQYAFMKNQSHLALRFRDLDSEEVALSLVISAARVQFSASACEVARQGEEFTYRKTCH